jgi:hypothetical protein
LNTIRKQANCCINLVLLFAIFFQIQIENQKFKFNDIKGSACFKLVSQFVSGRSIGKSCSFRFFSNLKLFNCKKNLNFSLVNENVQVTSFQFNIDFVNQLCADGH